MTPKEVRNVVTKQLEDYLGLRVYRSGQVAPEAELPYLIYSITSPYIAEPTMGHYDIEREANEAYLLRLRPPASRSSMSTPPPIIRASRRWPPTTRPPAPPRATR